MNNEPNTSNEVSNNSLSNEQVNSSSESNTEASPVEPNVAPAPPAESPATEAPSAPAETNPVSPVEPTPSVEQPAAPTPTATPAVAPVPPAPTVPNPAPATPNPGTVPQTPQEPTNNDQTIGTIKKEKKSIVPVILIFVVIIGVCVCLPYIYDFISPYFDNKKPNPEPTPVEPENPNPEEPTEQNPVEQTTDPIAISPEATIKYGNLTFKNMSLVEEEARYYINYTITNEGTNTYMGDEDLYLEIYNSENTFLGRTKVAAILSLNVGGNITSRSELSDAVYSSASKVGVAAKTEADYPNVTLNENNTLVCRKGINTVTYTFVDNKLTTFNDVYNYSIAKTETEKYASDALKYRNMLNSYINYGALTSFVENETETDSTFTASLTITLTDTLTNEQQTVLKNMNSSIFAKDTAPKVVKFEQEANAFICE